MSCSFNCSAPTPALTPNSDITGIGIITNNIVIASLAVVIIFLHYLIVYDPTRDPFQKDGQSLPTPFRTNPMDEGVLYMFKQSPLRYFFKISTRKSFPNFLIKCIRAMSDMQIITCFSILISGFLNLRCGLSTYHWLVIVHLAWLSCLTQLSCLTLLRKHLDDHPIERILRLLAVGVLVILLTVGLSFTGNYQWAFDADNGDHPTLSDPAICYMRPRPGMNSAFLSMPFSMVLIIFGFTSRVINLYDTLSVSVAGARTFLAGHIRRLLRIVYNWSDASRSPRSLKLTLCYLPLLSVYITCLVLVDVWDSAISEVVWLIVAFGFGIARVIGTIYRPEQMGLGDSLTGFKDWSFGQVASMVLLVAPLLTIIEYFQESDEAAAQDEEQPLSDSQTVPPPELPSISNSVATDPNDPDNDWISHPKMFGLISTHLHTFILAVMGWMANRNPFGMMTESLLERFLIFTGLGTAILIFGSLMVDTLFAGRKPTLHSNMQDLLSMYGIISINFGLSLVAKISYCLLPLIIIGALAHRFGGW